MSASALRAPMLLWHGLCQRLWPTALVTLGLLASLGAVTAPRLAVLLGALFAALGAVMVGGIYRDYPSALPHPAVLATVAAMLPAAIGGGAVLGLGPGVLVGSLVLAAVTVRGWAATAVARPRRPVDGPPDPAPDGRSLDELLRALPIDVLGDEWERTARPAGSSDDDSAPGMQLRRLLLAEFHRRDRAGTTRWLSEAPGARPDRYVGDARDRTT